MSARDRAFKVWQEINQKRDPVEWIELALNEQDKITRHAIAEALSEASEPASIEGADYREYQIIYEETAYRIAMNTIAV
jgi:hypothetical protein